MSKGLMLIFSICLLGLLSVSLFMCADSVPRLVSGRSAYATPPDDWPDVPVLELALFAREGRINQKMPDRGPAGPKRLGSFKAAQAYVLEQVDPSQRPIPKIALALSRDAGPDWTDIALDGAVIAQIPTTVLCEARAA